MRAEPGPFRALGAGLIVLVVACRAAAGAPPEPVKIPFIKGLTVVYAVGEPKGDYESLHTVVSIGRDGYRLKVSAQPPGNDEPDIALRVVSKDDQAHSHRVRDWFSAADPKLFPDTVPGFSREMLNYLALGDTHMTYLQIESGFVKNHVRRSLSGTLRLVGEGPEMLQMLVNGREVKLPVLHGKGKLGDAEGVVSVEYYVLADEDNPLVLKTTGPFASLDAVRIEYPLAGAAPDSIEQQLARHETVEIHSVYFAFGRADIQPESERVLKEIASILDRHMDWRLQIDGHTDAIGSDADNLELSSQRAAAVKAALVKQYGIDAARLATTGHGESQPKDSNDTIEGRSHNRRVELSRP
ncbi:MAG TPA: OmpA family protein [Rhodanobacteraceae bacterium]|nr:OmpA family protein [Rhodanobacteraceae bacterium]